MISAQLRNVGLAFLCVALFIGVSPLTVLSRGIDPSFQIYKDAKGSWLPAGYAFSHPQPFLLAAGGLAVFGLGLVLLSAILDWRERASIHKSILERKSHLRGTSEQK